MPHAATTSAGAVLRVRLLGGLDVRRGEEPSAPIESPRAQSLLARLLMARGAALPRRALAFELWPDSTEAQARTNLRHVLHNLRRGLPEPDRFLEVTPQTLRWRAEAPCTCDVDEFERLVDEADVGPDGAAAALRRAVAAYGGDLLPGCWDDWLLDARERLRARYRQALERLAGLLEASGEGGEALVCAEALARHDPLDEAACRLVMRLHDARGDRSRAVRAYHRCAAALERELGVEPAPATREAYEALLVAEGDAAAPAGAAGRMGRPPLIGRAEERRRLTDLWRAAEAGRAQLALVSGEPGVGKSRLVEELREWCAHRGAATALARAYPAEGALAYAPVAEWLRSDALAGRLGRLEPAARAELARLLPELAVRVPAPARPEPLPEEEGRQRLFDAAARALLAAPGPVLLVADDLQWWDRESLRFLHYLLRARPGAPLLVAATARREEIDDGHPAAELLAALAALGRLAEVECPRLTAPETALLGERVAGRPLPADLAARLHRATEGNPLFVLEAMRAGWGGDGAGDGWMTPRVQAVIEARLGQLSAPARELLDVAAVVGSELTADLLAEAGGADEDAIVPALDELWRRRILREQGADGYGFVHDSIREVAERGLSPARRRSLHRRVAAALERLHADDLGPVSGRLAAHHEAAGDTGPAVERYRAAAGEALRLHATAEAVRLLRRALALQRARPPSRARDAGELAILIELATPLGSVEGYASADLDEARRRARELTGVLGAEPDPRLLRADAVAGISRGELAAARAAGERLRARGRRDDDDGLLVEADYTLGIAAFWGGRPVAAAEHFQAAVARHRPEHRRAHLAAYGLDPEVVCRSRLGNALMLLGRPREAARAREEALALAEEVGHPASREVALVFGAMLALDLGEPGRMRELVAELGAAAGGPTFRATRVSGDALAGYVEVLDGRAAEGIARIERSLAGASRDHAPGMRATVARLLVDACAAADDPRGGLAAADRALALDDGVTVWEAHARLSRAGFLARLGAPADEVAAELARALDVARRQGAAGPEALARAAAARLAEAGTAPGTVLERPASDAPGPVR